MNHTQPPYAIYLRKSRKDTEAEARGQPDTLLRHRERLLNLAKSMNLMLTDIYEEVVSGESIAARPAMQRLLAAVEQGSYAGVLVMEVERLARGDTMDQGLVAQTFKCSDTKIITPLKTFDPRDEYDEEYFEFGLFMSRREYKTINRRLQRGREASMQEGNFVGNTPPFGYDRQKRPKDKGFYLIPNPAQAPIVVQIFSWYLGLKEPRLSISGIVRRLREYGISSPTGRSWTNAVIRELLSNPTYAGWLRWGYRPQVRRVVGGEVVISRPRAAAEDVKLFPGLHIPLITQSQFDQARAYLAQNASKPGPKALPLANPLAGLIVCDQCGRAMIRRPCAKGASATLLCNTPGCSTVSSDLAAVEQAILGGLRLWLGGFSVSYRPNDHTADSSLLLASKQTLSRQLAHLASREQKAFSLVELGVYSPECFQTRIQDLQAERSQLQRQMAQLESALQLIAAPVPFSDQPREAAVYWVLDAYGLGQSAQEKNALLRSVLGKAVYHKSRRSRHPEGSDLTLTLHPLLPSDPQPTILRSQRIGSAGLSVGAKILSRDCFVSTG